METGRLFSLEVSFRNICRTTAIALCLFFLVAPVGMIVATVFALIISAAGESLSAQYTIGLIMGTSSIAILVRSINRRDDPLQADPPDDDSYC